MKWKKVRLTEICKPKQWKNLPISELTEDGYPVYGANGIIGKYKEYNHEYPTLAITCRGATCGTINITQPKSYITSNAMALNDLSNEVNQKFLYYALNKRGFKDIITGAAQPQITREGLSKIVLDIPESIEAQLHIASILSKAENLIAQRKESIRLLDEFLKSTFLEMFGDPVRNEKGFEIRNLTEFYINPKEGTKCGPFGSALKKDEFKDKGIAVWTMDNILKSGEFVESGCLFISDEKFEELCRYDVKNNDILISRAGTVGKMCIVKTDKEKSIISSNLIRLRLGKNLLPIYFFSLMKYCQTRVIKLKHGNEDAYTHMSTGILDKINFPYPPISLQTQFARIVEKTEVLKSQYQQSLQELENLSGSLSQRAFRGELISKTKEFNEH